VANFYLAVDLSHGVGAVRPLSHLQQTVQVLSAIITNEKRGRKKTVKNFASKLKTNVIEAFPTCYQISIHLVMQKSP
jgi:hypothetical protein